MKRLSRRRTLAGGAGALAAFLSPPWPAGLVAPALAAETTVRQVLPNGLVVIAEERRTADTVALQLAARAGSRDDITQLGAPGVAVITSRMLFQGTSRRPTETDLQRAATQVGGTLTRGTGSELSAYTCQSGARSVDVAFDLLADIVLDPLLDEAALARQKQIALQDQAQRRATPAALIGDLFAQTFFAGHPLGSPIIGTPESIRAITRDTVAATREQLWGAANLVLTVVGRISVPDAMAKAQRYFGALPAGSANTRAAVPLLPRDAPQTVRVQAGQQELQFRVGLPAPGLLDADRPAMRVLSALMSGASGRLFRELRTLRGLAYSAGSGYEAYTDAGAWYAAAGVDPQNLDVALDLVRTEIARLQDVAPESGEVAARISQIAGQQILADEANVARAGRLAGQEILGAESTEESVRRVRQVTPADVQRIAQTYLNLDTALTVVAGPAGSAG